MQALNSFMTSLGLKENPMTSQSLPYHPLNPLDPVELKTATTAVDKYLRTQDDVQPFTRLWYKAVTLKEPPKALLVPYLDGLAAGDYVDKLSRQVDVLVGAKRGKSSATWYGKPNPILVSTRELMETCELSYHRIEIALTLPRNGEGASSIDKCVVVPPHHHVACDGEEMNAAEEALLNNVEFKKIIAGLGLPPDATVVADGWVYGTAL